MELNSTNATNISYTELYCPQYGEEEKELLEKVSFFIEGVVQTIVAILGIVGNFLASYILCTRKEMRNAFNLLLVVMACFDSLYLFGSILESFRKQDVFDMATDIHTVLFPHLLYPFTQFSFTASIFMTIAIALERYIAVHYPLDYSQAMHEANALTIRIFKYVSAVVVITCIITFTKFLEGKVEWVPITSHCHMAGSNYTITNSTVFKPCMVPTALRVHPVYSIYYNWSRLLVLGVIPFVMLVFLNSQIFKDIKARSKRRFNPKAAASQSHTRNNTNLGGAGLRKTLSNTEKIDSSRNTDSVKNKLWFRKKSPKKKMTTLQITGDKVTVIDGPSTMVEDDVTEITRLHSNNIESKDDNFDDIHIKSVSSRDTGDTLAGNGREEIHNAQEISIITENANPIQCGATQKMESSNETQIQSGKMIECENLELIAQNGKESSENNDKMINPGWRTRIATSMKGGKPRFSDIVKLVSKNRHSTMNNEDGAAADTNKSRQNPPTAISVNDSRRKKEDNMAVIFMGFILVFLVCHLPRLLLNIHELFTIENAIKCMEAGHDGFPLWTGVAVSLSQFLLVINSTTNIFIYCCLSSKFREECIKFYQSICRRICCYQV